MDNKIWAKTLLNLYEKLNCMVNSSERQIDSMVRCMGQHGGDILNQFDRLIKKIAHKDLYRCTIVLIDEILAGLDNKDILVMRYLEDKPYKTISIEQNMSLRTVFRKFDSEIESFAVVLKRKGYDYDKCNEAWADDKIFKDTYQRIERNEIAYSKAPKITYCMDVEKEENELHLFNYGHCMGIYDKIYSKN